MDAPRDDITTPGVDDATPRPVVALVHWAVDALKPAGSAAGHGPDGARHRAPTSGGSGPMVDGRRR